MLLAETSRKRAAALAPWLAFAIMLAWAWRIWDIFRYVPVYQDVLEVAWGMRWYFDFFTGKRPSLSFTPLVFHPFGWHVLTVGYTPTLFSVAALLYGIGGAAFAYNVLALISLGVAFAGSLRLARLFTTPLPATVAALVFTFAGLRWFHIYGGHIGYAWTTSFFPWLLWGLESLRRTDPRSRQPKLVLLCGLLWGLMINFALYGIFLGGVAFAIWGRQLFSFRRIQQAVVAALIAVFVGLPVILPYAQAKAIARPGAFDAAHVAGWAASLNSFFIPPVSHPLEPVRAFSQSIYQGRTDESGMHNIGLVSTMLALLGLLIGLRSRPDVRHLIYPVVVGLVLAMGLVLTWDNRTVAVPSFQPVVNTLWDIGHSLKPRVFPRGEPHTRFTNGVPLPGFLLTAVLPYWDSARIVARYALLGATAIFVLAAVALQHLPKILRYCLIVVWLIEMLPLPTRVLPLDTPIHPAFAWLKQQQVPPGQGIIDVGFSSVLVSGEPLYAATFLHGVPTASLVSASWPAHGQRLWDYFRDKGSASRPNVALFATQYRVRYILFHLTDGPNQRRWEIAANNPALRPIGCHQPPEGPSPWAYPICVAERNPTYAGGIWVHPRKGWLQAEPWGIWASDPTVEAEWLATEQRDHQLIIEAEPLCVPGRQQTMRVQVKDAVIDTYQWNDCERREVTVTIPERVVRQGWNTIVFEFAYADRSGSSSVGQKDDQTPRAVAFHELRLVDPSGEFEQP